MSSPAAEPPVRVFVIVLLEDTPPAELESTEQTLRAQFQGVRATLQIETRPRAASLRAQADEVLALLLQHRAAGGFWVDWSGQDEAQLYFVEPDGKHILVRRIKIERGRVEAAIESIGVVTRWTTEAVIEGRTIGMEAAADTSVAPASQPESPPAPQPPPTVAPWTPVAEPPGGPVPSHARMAQPTEEQPWFRPPERKLPLLRLESAYVGTTFSDALGWHHGMLLGVRMLATEHWSWGGAGTLFPASVLRAEGTQLEIERQRWQLCGAGELWLRAVGLGLETAFLVERLERRTLRAEPGYTPTPPSARIAVGGMLAARVTVYTSPQIPLFVVAGPELLGNAPTFAVEEGQIREVSESYALRMRLAVGAGLDWQD